MKATSGGVYERIAHLDLIIKLKNEKNIISVADRV